ncbi:MAG TPA: helix-turn-helix domain-containing protein [Rhizobiales bacterium]|nr:helix-turn-helix domain-containing protein [Hyphomicrobiales bacterium]
MAGHSLSGELTELIKQLACELDDQTGLANDIYADRLGINRCQVKQSLTHMCFGVPTAMMTIIGQKNVTVEENTYRLTAGDVFLLPEDVSFDVQNVPDPQKGRYLGIAIRFDAETLALFRTLYGNRFDNWDLTPRWHARGPGKAIAAASDWISWIRRYASDQTQTRHRMVELLLVFASQGIAGNLILKLHHSWKHRLKQLFLLDPARPWRMDEVCRKLAVSESTLRRHLSEENIGFRKLLEEVRLEHGMGLIMSSDMLISQVGLGCGYQSQSRFAERFRKRFSMSPMELRNSRKKPPAGDNIVNFSLPTPDLTESGEK